jgi:nucleoside-diphosphate-sugar epimerase
MRCVVTGGSGFIGSHLVEALIGRGADVICLVRGTSDLRWIQNSTADIRVADLSDCHDVVRHFAGVDSVFHCAGAIAAQSAADFRRTNADLTRSLVEACASAPRPPHAVYVGSLAAAGPSSPNRPLAEDDEPRPISAYGRSKLAGERIVRGYAGHVPVTIVRPPVVYGPRDRGLLGAFRIVAWRLRPEIGRERRLSLISVHDLVAGLIRIIETRAAIGRTYYLTHPVPLSMCELARRIEAALGVRALPIPVPDPLLTAAGSLAQIPMLLTGRAAPFNAAKAREIKSPGWVCDGSRARIELGFEPAGTHEQALRETAEWYRKHGWI